MKLRRAESLPQEKLDERERTDHFEQIFLEHWNRINRLLLRLVGDPAEAEDLALEAFYRLYRQFPATHEDFNTGGWLHRVATNLGLHSIRSHNRREKYEMNAGKDFLHEAVDDHPESIFSLHQEIQNARRTLAQMKPRQAQLLIYRYSGWAYKDIARALDLSPTSIGPLLLRAEREFEKRFRSLNQEDA